MNYSIDKIHEYNYLESDIYMNSLDYPYLDDTQYNIVPNDTSISLSDKIVIYNTDDKWIFVNLNILLKYPFIHIKSNNKYRTLVVCPLTLRCVIIDDKFYFYRYDNGTLYIRNDDHEISQIDLKGKVIIESDDTAIEKQNKRYEVKICTLKQGMLEYPDSDYLILKDKNDILTPILRLEYYNNNTDVLGHEYKNTYIHPKTLVYIIQYLSKSGKIKETILLGRDANQLTPTGYNFKESGLFEYLVEYENDIIRKKAYLIPMLYIHAVLIYKESPIIKIKDPNI